MATSCSHWWHAPVYFTLSIVLAIIAITSTFPPKYSTTTTIPNSNNETLTHDLFLKATEPLRLHGYSAIATLFQVSPELFLLSPSSQSTIFAIQDSAFTNISLPPWAIKRLLQYHTILPNFSFRDLLVKSSNTSCLTTSIQERHVVITKINDSYSEVVDDTIHLQPNSIEINNVPVTHPDLFLHGPISIHGVLRPFASLDNVPDQELHLRGVDFIQRSPICDGVQAGEQGREIQPQPEPQPDHRDQDGRPEWVRVIRWLSSNGFVSFSIGLHSALDGILREYYSPVKELNTATIFAPPVLASVGLPSAVLDRMVRYHMVPKMYRYGELIALGENASKLRTLLPEGDIEITGGDMRVLTVNGVGIVSPDSFAAGGLIIHGISQAFVLPELAVAS